LHAYEKRRKKQMIFFGPRSRRGRFPYFFVNVVKVDLRVGSASRRPSLHL
jgi:hypothetical protein